MGYNQRKGCMLKTGDCLKIYMEFIYQMMKSSFPYSLRTLSDRLITFRKEMEGFLSVETGQSKKKEPELLITDYPPTKSKQCPIPLQCHQQFSKLQSYTQIQYFILNMKDHQVSCGNHYKMQRLKNTEKKQGNQIMPKTEILVIIIVIAILQVQKTL